MNYPDYSYPPGMFARVALYILFLRRRSFRSDAIACIQNLKPPLRVLGTENIPRHGPCVLTVNHYHRPGFGAQWFALAMAARVPLDIHWIITAEFSDWSERYGSPGALASRMLLRRIARIYGFTTMPPMPPRPQEVEARAASVRAVLEYVRARRAPVLGLAPEGHDPPSGVLTRPAPGLGRFGSLLARAGLHVVPVGVYEAEGIFHLHFGERYALMVASGLSTDEKDALATETIMKNIARLLPLHLRGEFA
jgi:hypothetical protein